jgi:hypothetical protein
MQKTQNAKKGLYRYHEKHCLHKTYNDHLWQVFLKKGYLWMRIADHGKVLIKDFTQCPLMNSLFLSCTFWLSTADISR